MGWGYRGIYITVFAFQLVKIVSLVNMMVLDLMNVLTIVLRNYFIILLIVGIEILRLMVKSLDFDGAIDLEDVAVEVLRRVDEEFAVSGGILGQVGRLEFGQRSC